jgi:L-lactate dehydrogenase
MTGQYGVQDICLSLPCVVGVHGVEEVLALTLNQEEEGGFHASAVKLKDTLHAMKNLTG